MNLFKRILLLVILFSGFLLSVRAQRDSLRFCLLTCSPGTEVYALYGHTAIRYQNFTQQQDIVFNYGMFSFNTPHFIYRFVKGETDYKLGIAPFKYFEAEYTSRGSSVYEQELNLTQSEKEKLFRLLSDNYRKENRTYRYNYFFDNCTTRARDQIEKCISGKIVYNAGVGKKSFRSIIHEFTINSPWSEFGNDLCLGAEADRPIDNREQMFSPIYMKNFASTAYIQQNDGGRRKLVTCETTIVKGSRVIDPSLPFTPMMFGISFLILNIVVAWLQVRRSILFWGYDLLLYLSQGLAGCIIAFLFFVSVHPTVGSNWLILLFNPVPLLMLPYILYKDLTKTTNHYFLFKMVYLTLFIMLIPFSLQEFNITILPLALGLLINSVGHLLVYNKRK